jgi:hypothetical protein
MIDFLMAAALAEATAIAGTERIAPTGDSTEIIVEAPLRTRSWNMPRLDFGASEECTSWWEGQVPGFGTISFGPSCADGTGDVSIDDLLKGELP